MGCGNKIIQPFNILNSEVSISFIEKKISFSLGKSEENNDGKHSTIIKATDREMEQITQDLLMLLKNSFDNEEFINASFSYERKKKGN